MKLKASFGIMLAVIATSFISTAGLNLYSNRHLQVNGEAYAEIVQGKDLIADILPPPAFVVEAYLNALQMQFIDAGKRAQLKDRFEETRKEFRERHAFWKGSNVDAGVKAEMGKVFDSGMDFYNKAESAYFPALNGGKGADATLALRDMQKLFEIHRAHVVKSVELANAANASIVDTTESHIDWANTIQFTLLALALAASVSIGGWIMRSLLGRLNAINGVFGSIGQGKYDNLIAAGGDDELGAVMDGLAAMQAKLGHDLIQTQKVAKEMARINLALKEVGSSVTVSDEDGELIFVNAAGEAMLSRIMGMEASLTTLKGRSIDQLASNEAMQRSLKENRERAVSVEGEINGLHIRIDSAPVYDNEKKYIGHVTQWLDRTEEVEAERRAEEAFRMSFALKNVETAVTVSNEEHRLIFINSVGAKLFESIASEGDGIDRLIGTPLSDVVADAGLKALLTRQLSQPETAEGTLNGHIIRLYSAPITDAQGRYIGRLSQWLDRTAEVAAEREISQLVESVACGDFSRRMDESDKEGFFRVIAQGLNQLSEVSERGLNEVAGVLNALANGDLTQRMESDYEGMFGQIKDDANRTVDQLRDIVGAITEATDAIHGAAREIVAGNTDLGQRTESQSASLEQTAASTEELNSTVKNNDDNARQANELAKNATEVAARGGQVVQQVVETMGAITESSTKIAEIISVIDGIAFQTNILALNAAVEAARAGEQGRGFAVVAGEVRNLAQRSAAAAKEIKQLISESVTKVTTGHRLVEAAGATMSEVVESIGRVSHIMNEITVSSAEQRNGIEQLNLAITNMDEATQQNVALVEEASAAAQAMEDQTQNLKQAVSTFRMEGPAAEDWDGRTERRSPNRPANVERLPGTRPGTPTRSGKPKTAIGGEGSWEQF